jgi:hypothetical protein
MADPPIANGSVWRNAPLAFVSDPVDSSAIGFLSNLVGKIVSIRERSRSVSSISAIDTSHEPAADGLAEGLACSASAAAGPALGRSFSNENSGAAYANLFSDFPSGAGAIKSAGEGSLCSAFSHIGTDASIAFSLSEVAGALASFNVTGLVEALTAVEAVGRLILSPDSPAVPDIPGAAFANASSVAGAVAADGGFKGCAEASAFEASIAGAFGKWLGGGLIAGKGEPLVETIDTSFGGVLSDVDAVASGWDFGAVDWSVFCNDCNSASIFGLSTIGGVRKFASPMTEASEVAA